MIKRKTSLRRGAPLKRGRIAQVSTRRRAELADYAVLRKLYLAENPLCEVWLAENGWHKIGPNRWEKTCLACESLVAQREFLRTQGAPDATEIHHKAKRRGKTLNDTTTWLAVCRKNHERIENNKAWARANGFLVNF